MTRHRGTEIICDECQETEFFLDLHQARESGWKIGRTKDLCYEHRDHQEKING